MMAAIIILVALLVSIARFLTPALNAHRADFEKIASEFLQMPVLIHDVKVAWRGYAPEISLSNVTILDPTTEKPKISIQHMDIDFSIWRSVWSRTVFIESMVVAGVDLDINQETADQYQIGDLTKVNLKDTLTGESVKADTIIAWIFSQPQLALEDIHLRYLSQHIQQSITLKRLALRNTVTHHVLDGQAVLNQDMPTKVDIHLGWDGDVRKLLEAKAHVYLYFEGLSLPQWLSKQTWGGYKITQGIASTKVWVRWENNRIQKVQSEFNVYGLELYSIAQNRIEEVNRMSGVVGWRREDKSQFFVGEQILIDLPGHLWPTTSFAVTASEDVQGGLSINHVQFNYLDMVDTARFILGSNLLSEQQRQTLIALNPQGDITTLQANLPADLTDIQHMIISGKLARFAINAWQNFPGVNNLSGSLSWDGSQVNVDVDSKKISLLINQLFAQPIEFDNLTAAARISRDSAGNWLVNVRNFHADNADLVFDSTITATVPHDNQPTLDFTSHFTIAHVVNVSHYLPVKIFDPDLTKWLRSAFLSGQAEEGKIIIQGNMKDFPFDTLPATGKFLISTSVKDVELNYGPGWPHLQHLNGMLTFAGSAMTVDVNKGQILDVPINQVHAVIPYLGNSAPQILNVDGLLQGDAASGLRFIQQSPLQKTIGKDLSALKLIGPMQLKLALTVPLKKPDNTRVNGDVVLTNATLTMPDWRLQLDKLNGGFNFTEDSINAKNITGETFGEPIALQMTTLHEKGVAGQLRADLSSAISIASLQNWLGLKLDNIATGRTPYQLQVFLSSHAATEQHADHLIVSTDLAGVELKAPLPYGKLAIDKKDLQVTIDLNDSKLLKTKIDYNKLLSAALTLKKSPQGFQFVGGELHLGSANASFQTEPGILITGDLASINVQEWQDYFSSLRGEHISNEKLDFKLLRGLDLRADIIDVLNTHLHQAHVKLTPANSNWLININSAELSGDVTLPFKLNEAPIQGHFQRIKIPSSLSDMHKTIDPRTVPAMSVEVDDISYHDIQFGHVYLDIVPSRAGLVIKQLRIDESTLKLHASGEWTQEKNKDYSRLQGELNAPNIGAVLTQWGFNSSSLVGSTGDMKFDLSWQNTPYQPSMTSLSGNISLRLGEGRIVNLSESTNSKMGLGRLLNLLSLSNIPRRLSLDFSDFGQGYSFDTMMGEFNFKDGNAFVDKMHFEGPIAGLQLKGRIGLVAKDFDMQLGVTPHVTGSLPVVAAIAGGPIVGVATWLVDRVVSHAVAKSSNYEYHITGPWDNPVWTKLDATSQ